VQYVASCCLYYFLSLCHILWSKLVMFRIIAMATCIISYNSQLPLKKWTFLCMKYVVFFNVLFSVSYNKWNLCGNFNKDLKTKWFTISLTMLRFIRKVILGPGDSLYHRRHQIAATPSETVIQGPGESWAVVHKYVWTNSGHGIL